MGVSPCPVMCMKHESGAVSGPYFMYESVSDPNTSFTNGGFNASF